MPAPWRGPLTSTARNRIASGKSDGLTTFANNYPAKINMGITFDDVARAQGLDSPDGGESMADMPAGYGGGGGGGYRRGGGGGVNYLQQYLDQLQAQADEQRNQINARYADNIARLGGVRDVAAKGINDALGSANTAINQYVADFARQRSLADQQMAKDAAQRMQSYNMQAADAAKSLQAVGASPTALAAANVVNRQNIDSASQAAKDYAARLNELNAQANNQRQQSMQANTTANLGQLDVNWQKLANAYVDARQKALSVIDQQLQQAMSSARSGGGGGGRGGRGGGYGGGGGSGPIKTTATESSEFDTTLKEVLPDIDAIISQYVGNETADYDFIKKRVVDTLAKNPNDTGTLLSWIGQMADGEAKQSWLNALYNIRSDTRSSLSRTANSGSNFRQSATSYGYGGAPSAPAPAPRSRYWWASGLFGG